MSNSFLFTGKSLYSCFFCRNQNKLIKNVSNPSVYYSVSVFDCSRPSSTTPPTTPHRPTSPTTPESAHHSARIADRMCRNQMTDPDHRCSQARGKRHSDTSTPPPPPQPNFAVRLAADIPQVHIPEIHRLPVATFSGSVAASGSGVPVVARPSVSEDPFRILPSVTSGVDYQLLSGSNIPQVQLPPDWNAPLRNPVPLRPPPSVYEIPQVQLPENWNAPLQNPVPIVPPAPVFPSRGRGRG